MSSFTGPVRLAVAEIIIYACFLVPTVWATWKHGKVGMVTWQLLVSLCAMRIAAGALMIADRNALTKLGVGVFLTEAGTISLLVTAPVGVVYETCYYISACKLLTNKIILGLLHLASLVFITIATLGTGLALKAQKTRDAKELAGYIGLLAVLLLTFIHTLFTYTLRLPLVRNPKLARNLRILLYSNMISIPFTAVRIGAAVAMAFDRNMTRDPVLGSFWFVFFSGFLPQLLAAMPLIASGWWTRHVGAVGEDVVERPGRIGSLDLRKEGVGIAVGEIDGEGGLNHGGLRAMRFLDI